MPKTSHGSKAGSPVSVTSLATNLAPAQPSELKLRPMARRAQPLPHLDAWEYEWAQEQHDIEQHQDGADAEQCQDDEANQYQDDTQEYIEQSFVMDDMPDDVPEDDEPECQEEPECIEQYRDDGPEEECIEQYRDDEPQYDETQESIKQSVEAVMVEGVAEPQVEGTESGAGAIPDLSAIVPWQKKIPSDKLEAMVQDARNLRNSLRKAASAAHDLLRNLQDETNQGKGKSAGKGKRGRGWKKGWSWGTSWRSGPYSG